MRRRGGAAAIAGNPVLIGAATMLIVIVGIFLTYNANKGLPFVPTYDITVEVPTAVGLTDGNEVRIAGFRVGIIDSIEPNVHEDGKVTALLRLKLQKSAEPIPTDTTFSIRQRSTLGAKFLGLVPGDESAGVPNGGTLPGRQGRAGVDLDQFFDMFSDRTRRGIRGTLTGFGNGLAGRGQDLNIAIQQLAPLLDRLEPVAGNLADPVTRLGAFVRNLGATQAIVASVAAENADWFVNMDTTFSALAGVTGDIQETIVQSPPTEAQVTADLPDTRPLLRNLTLLSRDLKPGANALPSVASNLAEAVTKGTPTLRRSVAFDHQLAGTFASLQDFSENAQVPLALDKLNELVVSLDPLVSFLTPAQTVCNYATVLFRNLASVNSEHDANGTWARTAPIVGLAGSNSEALPSTAPANGPEAGDYVHSDFYPNTAAPGQARECEAGNEKWVENQSAIGNQAGNQGVGTDTSNSVVEGVTGGGK